ncbi:MAG TPA: hypothetical protein VFW63_08765, partial [Acidimicrobiales bacterium]|nr:hypothetical protein [Acidimicrobiales bacterium]
AVGQQVGPRAALAVGAVATAVVVAWTARRLRRATSTGGDRARDAAPPPAAPARARSTVAPVPAPVTALATQATTRPGAAAASRADATDTRT